MNKLNSNLPNETKKTSELPCETNKLNSNLPNEANETTGSPSSLSELHKQYNMASNYKGLYGIFYKISMEVVKSVNSQ